MKVLFTIMVHLGYLTEFIYWYVLSFLLNHQEGDVVSKNYREQTPSKIEFQLVSILSIFALKSNPELIVTILIVVFFHTYISAIYD